MNIADLKPFTDRTVVLHLTDGEVLTAKVTFVDMEYQDVIVDVIETDRPERYNNPDAVYAIPASAIVAVKSSN